MSQHILRRLAVFGCAALLGALVFQPAVAAQTKPAPTHDAVFEVGGATYSGATTFTIDKAGKVTGTMKLDTPALVDARLNGEVKDGVWTFNYPFTMDNQGQPCSGTVSGTAQVKADGAEATGAVTIGGDCSPDALTGTFAFKKKAK
jgi:hypothetical protein